MLEGRDFSTAKAKLSLFLSLFSTPSGEQSSSLEEMEKEEEETFLSSSSDSRGSVNQNNGTNTNL